MFVYVKYVIYIHPTTHMVVYESSPMKFRYVDPPNCRLCDYISLRLYPCNHIPFSDDPGIIAVVLSWKYTHDILLSLVNKHPILSLAML